MFAAHSLPHRGSERIQGAIRARRDSYANPDNGVRIWQTMARSSTTVAQW